MDGIRRELDVHRPREEARVPPPVVPNSAHAVLERDYEVSTWEQWWKMLLAALGENKDEAILKRPFRDNGELSFTKNREQRETTSHNLKPAECRRTDRGRRKLHNPTQITIPQKTAKIPIREKKMKTSLLYRNGFTA